jgi:hypothetical protein
MFSRKIIFGLILLLLTVSSLFLIWKKNQINTNELKISHLPTIPILFQTADTLRHLNQVAELNKKTPTPFLTAGLSTKPSVVSVQTTDSTQTRILLTGDSMADGLYLYLLKLKKINKINVIYRPWYGSTSMKWAQKDTLPRLIERFRPHLVIFSMGANELFVPLSASRIKSVQKVVSPFGQTPYVWVGPPSWAKDWGIDSVLGKEAGANYFRSKDLKFERAPDKMHPTFRACEFWMDTLAKWINKSESYNFKFNLLSEPKNKKDTLKHKAQ